MKKIFLLMIMLSCTLLLASCDSACAIETVDENGEKVTLNVVATDDKEEICDVIVAINELEPKELESEAAKFTVKSSMTYKDANSNEMSYSANVTYEINDDLESHAGIDLTVKYNIKAEEIETKNNITLKGDVYTDSNFLYVDGSAKHSNSTLELKNKMSISTITHSIQGMLGQVGNMLPSMGSTDFEMPEYTTEEDVLEFVEKYGIEISSTSKSTVTFKADVTAEELEMEIESDAKLSLYITIDVNTKLPTGIKIDASSLLDSLKEADENIKTVKFSFEAKIEYDNIKIKELDDSEKKDYKEFNQLELVAWVQGLTQ